MHHLPAARKGLDELKRKFCMIGRHKLPEFIPAVPDYIAHPVAEHRDRLGHHVT